ncbi:MAG TPA: phytanoyl-CoA dioxygenase family protein [Caulobacteraceae bacterium]|nr:phytanoyl-CoA dioxygenase family protein [Caulobacteraceae bacterium]
MRIPDAKLAEVWDRGFTVVEGFLDKETLSAAQDALWGIYPRPEDYFANPDAHPRFARSQFAGLRFFPYNSWALNRIPVYPDLIDAAERFLQTTEIDCYKVELWGKYAGAIDYDQSHHRDYENHTIVVPRADQLMPQMTCFILLSDVTEVDGPTKAVPIDKTRHIPIGITRTKMGDFFDDEVAVTGPAGTILIYKTDVFHRGSDFKAPGRSRFVMPVDYKPRGWRWQGKMGWPDHATTQDWKDAMVRMTPRQRDLFGFPPPGDPYWNAQTLSDVALRYPGMDMAPYAEAAGVTLAAQDA